MHYPPSPEPFSFAVPCSPLNAMQRPRFWRIKKKKSAKKTRQLSLPLKSIANNKTGLCDRFEQFTLRWKIGGCQSGGTETRRRLPSVLVAEREGQPSSVVKGERRQDAVDPFFHIGFSWLFEGRSATTQTIIDKPSDPFYLTEPRAIEFGSDCAKSLKAIDVLRFEEGFRRSSPSEETRLPFHQVWLANSFIKSCFKRCTSGSTSLLQCLLFGLLLHLFIASGSAPSVRATVPPIFLTLMVTDSMFCFFCNTCMYFIRMLNTFVWIFCPFFLPQNCVARWKRKLGNLCILIYV